MILPQELIEEIEKIMAPSQSTYLFMWQVKEMKETIEKIAIIAYQAGHTQGQIDGAKGRFQDFKEITIESQLSASLYNSIFEKGRQAGLKEGFENGAGTVVDDICSRI